MVSKQLFYYTLKSGPSKGYNYKLIQQPTVLQRSRIQEENERSTGNMMVPNELVYLTEVKPSQGIQLS